MSREMDAKQCFESECGRGVRYEGVKVGRDDAAFSFTIISRGSTHTIGTNPKNGSSAALKDAAIQAGRWAKIMAERVAM